MNESHLNVISQESSNSIINYVAFYLLSGYVFALQHSPRSKKVNLDSRAFNYYLKINQRALFINDVVERVNFHGFEVGFGKKSAALDLLGNKLLNIQLSFHI